MTTALITGASAGIGMELARQFARDGHDLVLTARRMDRLHQVAHEITDAFGVRCHVLAADLSLPQAASDLYAETRKLGVDVDYLVNNAGFGSVGRFVELDAQQQIRMIDLNVRALTAMTRCFLPSMLSRGAGGILNVASVAAYQPGPYMAVYYASKSYVLSFSLALREEVRGRGVTVTCLAPGPTKSEFAERAGLDNYRFFTTGAQSSAAVASAGYRGFVRNKGVVVPGLRNRVMVSIVPFLPRAITCRIVARLQAPR
jgi:short-subunit dehydrogenase